MDDLQLIVYGCHMIDFLLCAIHRQGDLFRGMSLLMSRQLKNTDPFEAVRERVVDRASLPHQHIQDRVEHVIEQHEHIGELRQGR